MRELFKLTEVTKAVSPIIGGVGEQFMFVGFHSPCVTEFEKRGRFSFPIGLFVGLLICGFTLRLFDGMRKMRCIFLFLLLVCGFTVCGFPLALIYGLLFVIAVAFDALYVRTFGFTACGFRRLRTATSPC